MGYMLFFHFPKFAKVDPFMSPDGDCNDCRFGYVNSQCLGEEDVLASAVSDE